MPNEKCYTSYIHDDDVFSRTVLRGRFIIEGFLHDYAADVQDLLQHMGWLSLLHRSGKTYTELVKEFYFNLRKDGKTKVKGVTMQVNPAVINDVLGIKAEDRKESKGIDQMNIDVIFREVTNNASLKSGVKKVDTIHLPLEVRLLHKIVVGSLQPRRGNVSTIMLQDAKLMWCIMKKKKRDLGKIVFSHMKYSLTKSKLSLPYGFWISLILQHFQVPTAGEHSDESIPQDKINKYVLDRMGLQYDHRGWHSKRRKLHSGTNDSEPETGENGDDSINDNTDGHENPEAENHSVDNDEVQVPQGRGGFREDNAYSTLMDHLQRMEDKFDQKLSTLKTTVEDSLGMMMNTVQGLSVAVDNLSSHFVILQNEIIRGGGKFDMGSESLQPQTFQFPETDNPSPHAASVPSTVPSQKGHEQSPKGSWRRLWGFNS